MSRELSDYEKTMMGESTDEWADFIRRGYIMAPLLYGLLRNGVLAALIERPYTVEELAKKLKLDARQLGAGLYVLRFIDDSFTYDEEGRYGLTEKGKVRMAADTTHRALMGLVGSYKTLLFNYVDTLNGTLEYGKDFVRDGELTAQTSILLGQGAYPWIVDTIKRLGATTVVDLGCGSGEVLIEFCKLSADLEGVGVDIDPAAIEDAKIRVKAAGLEDRIQLSLGDFKKPDTYAPKLTEKPEKIAFHSMMALHEFLIDGEDAVVDILVQMKKTFPGAHLLLGEFDAISDEGYHAMPLFARLNKIFYQKIVHELTPQRLTDQSGWRRIFDKAGVTLVETKETGYFQLVEFLVRF